MKRITQQDIARKLGLHTSTVSKALKGDPAVAAKTVKQVRNVAAEMGFVPDPMLTALSSYRKQQQPEGYHATIAWLYNHQPDEKMSRYAGFNAYILGARERAAELGYRIEEFWIEDSPRATENVERILMAKGIRCMIVAPQASPERSLDIDWEKYVSVAIGYTLSKPELDRVTNDHYNTMVRLLEKLRSHGYQRIGCYLWETDNQRMEGRAGSALQEVSRDFPVMVKRYTDFDAEIFVDWVQFHQLDAVVCRGIEQMKALQDAGLKIPERIGFAGYALDENEKTLSGMQHNNRQIGSVAVDWVTGKYQRSQFGLSEHTQRLLVTSQWLENGSVT